MAFVIRLKTSNTLYKDYQEGRALAPPAITRSQLQCYHPRGP